jgi:hypothetical protein
VDLVPLNASGATDPIRAIAAGAAHMVALSGTIMHMHGCGL